MPNLKVPTDDKKGMVMLPAIEGMFLKARVNIPGKGDSFFGLGPEDRCLCGMY
jgi:hypothetical protein